MTKMTKTIKIPKSFSKRVSREHFREKSTKTSFPSSSTSTNGSIPALDRAAAYVARIPAAVSGEGGHDQTFAVACSLAHGFALPPADALPILLGCGARCQPPWSKEELRHKLADAEKLTRHPKPKGHLMKQAAPPGIRTASLPSRETSPPVPTSPAIIGQISLPPDLIIRKRGESPPDAATNPIPEVIASMQIEKPIPAHLRPAPEGECNTCHHYWGKSLLSGHCICTGDVAIRPGHPKKAIAAKT